MKNKKISTISFILAGLATSKFCLIWTIVIDGFLKLFSPDVHSSGNLIEYNGYLWIVMNQSSIWFATCLSIFYFLKISTFSHRIFLWLKGRLNMVLFLLLGCLLISWLPTCSHPALRLSSLTLPGSSVASTLMVLPSTSLSLVTQPSPPITPVPLAVLIPL